MSATPTVLSRMLAAGISEEQIVKHHLDGVIRLDGEPIADLDTPAPPPARIVIAGREG